MFKVVCAPDSFKGSLAASEVARAMERGIKSFCPEAEVVKLPLSDGGEGLVDSLVAATKGKKKNTVVTDPLGRKVEAGYGILGDGQGVMEMAAASGLPLVAPEELNPLRTTTFGTGELLQALLDEGCRTVIVGIGGSATNDGGIGMLQALGGRFFDSEGKELGWGGGELNKLADFNLEGLDPRIEKTEIKVACDVDNPLTGENGATRVYGPQKGATLKMIEELERGLGHFGDLIREKKGIEVNSYPGSGAAGGLGAGMMVFLGGKLQPGVDLVLDTVRFEDKIKGADLVITGEGRLDKQTIYGKTALGVVRRSKKIPVVAVGGWVEPEIALLREEGLTAFFSILDRPRSLEEAMKIAPMLLERSCEEIIRLFFSGRKT